MTSFDFAPFHRSTVGFDRMFSLLDKFEGEETTYPPYNIEKTGDDTYRITLAVAGFVEDELSVDLKEGTLIITGAKKEDEGEKAFLHRGIAARNFNRQFQLADHIQVTGAFVENGLLNVELVREVPEALKPRSIAIANGNRLIEGKKKKAA